MITETNNYELLVLEEDRLKGLPISSKESARNLAKSKGLKGFLFTLNNSDYVSIITYVEDREIRKEIYNECNRKGFKKNRRNIEEIIKKIVNLRHERVILLGYESYSQYVLKERMANSPEKVMSFLNNIFIKAKPVAIEELKNLNDYASNIEGFEFQLEPWDTTYYEEKLKNELFHMNDELLKPYFELERVIKGAFEVANRLYDLNFIQVFDIDTYHPDVRTYEVYNNKGKFMAILYTDFFERKGKSSGAWEILYKDACIKNRIEERPHISLVCNFTPPSEKKASLLYFENVITFFHEFGHCIHDILINVSYYSLKNDNICWDFVEAPSQLLENWCFEPETLSLFAKHYETNEIIPTEYIENIKIRRKFHIGIETIKNLRYSFLDMAYFLKHQEIKNVKLFEQNAVKLCSLYEDISENCLSTSFSHIFGGEYGCGYYSYLWSQVIEDDAFEYFKQNGIFNKILAAKFCDCVLSKGAIEHPMVLYKNFRGKEPSLESFLKRRGFI